MVGQAAFSRRGLIWRVTVGAESLNVYLPNSFEDRGVTIPFTNEVIRNARLRGDDPEDREFLLPGLSGGDGTYVVPYDSLGDLIELNLYDRALVDHLRDAFTITPLDLRQAVLDIDAKGYGGVDKAKAAKQEIEYSGNVGIFNQCLLIVRAVKLLTDDSTDLDLKVLITPAGQKKAKEHFNSYAEKAGTSADEIMKKLEYWANLIGLIGVRGADHPGCLLKEQTRLLGLSGDLKAYLEKEPSEVQFMGNGVVKAAEVAGELVIEHMEKCWALEDDIGQTLENSAETMVTLKEQLDTVSWVLDGWQRMIDAWDESAESFRSARRKVIEMMYENIPILPRNILGGAHMEAVNLLREQQTGWVKENMDWRTNELDTEMVARLSQFQKVAA